jgi:hypothetical protein
MFSLTLEDRPSARSVLGSDLLKTGTSCSERIASMGLAATRAVGKWTFPCAKLFRHAGVSFDMDRRYSLKGLLTGLLTPDLYPQLQLKIFPPVFTQFVCVRVEVFHGVMAVCALNAPVGLAWSHGAMSIAVDVSTSQSLCRR